MTGKDDLNERTDSNTPADKITFTNTYTENKTAPKPVSQNSVESTKTDNKRMVNLWIVLSFAFGFGIVETTVYSKKQKSYVSSLEKNFKEENL